MIGKIGKILNQIEAVVLTTSLVVMVIVIFVQVVMRYVFQNALHWPEEFARYLFVWFSWIGVSAGLKDGEHLKVEMLSVALVRKGYLKLNGMINILVLLIWLATTSIISYYGFQVMASQIELGVFSPAIRMPMWIGYLSIPACGAIIGVRLIVKIIENVQALLGKVNYEREVAN